MVEQSCTIWRLNIFEDGTAVNTDSLHLCTSMAVGLIGVQTWLPTSAVRRVGWKISLVYNYVIFFFSAHSVGSRPCRTRQSKYWVYAAGNKATTKTDWLRYPAGQPSVSKMNCGLAERRVRAQEPLCESRSGRPGIPSVMKWLGLAYPRRRGRVFVENNWGVSARYGVCTASLFFFIAALRPRKREGLLGTGTEWEGDDRVKARPRKPGGEKDRRDRGPPPERQWKGVPFIVPYAIAVSTAVLGHWELQRQCPLHCCWRRTTWTTRSKTEVHLAQPSSTSLLMISSGLSWGSSSISLL